MGLQLYNAGGCPLGGGLGYQQLFHRAGRDPLLGSNRRWSLFNGYGEKVCDKASQLPVLEYGAAAYDDQYLYLTNAIRYMDSQGTVPAEERGVKVYDLQGNLQQFIPVPQESGNALLLLFTPGYVFFCDDRNGSYCPTLYLEKAAVSSGTAQILPVG